MHNATRRRSFRAGPGLLLTAFLVASLLAFSAHAQRQQGGQSQPILERVKPQDWTVRSQVFVVSDPVEANVQGRGTASHVRFATRFVIEGADVVFPLLEGSASHETYVDKVESELMVEGTVVDDEPDLLTGYPVGERLGRWKIPAIDAVRWRLRVDLPMTTYETRLNEKAARAVKWPTDGWPEIARGALSPQLFVESDDPAVRALVQKWTKGRAKTVPPALLAKALMKEVIEHVQPSSQGVANTEDIGTFSGLALGGAAFAARTGRGTPFDLPALLCAVYRAAGLPARVVVGFDIPATIGDEAGIFDVGAECHGDTGGQPSNVPILHVWVEFMLYDEGRGEWWWIPVDPIRQRDFSSRAPALDREWKFFGNNECLKNVAPLSFHFHPPTTVVNAGAPALWGWLPRPRILPADQSISFDAFHTPKTAEDFQRK